MGAFSIKDEVFKAYDIRGICPEEINEEFAFELGRVFAGYLGARRLVLGRDNRLSSESLCAALADGILAAGVEVVDIGMSSTDMLYFAVARFGYGGGIMVTASHNPPQYNGFKLVREKAVPIGSESGLEEVKKMMRTAAASHPGGKGSVAMRPVLADFVSFCRSFVDTDCIRGLKVVMDTSNAMGGLIAPAMFAGLDIEIVPMHFRLDGTFPNHPANPFLEENRLELMERVVEEQADLGVAWDGDTDRCFFIDEQGAFVNSDFIVALLSRSVLARNPGATILYDLRSSKYVPETISRCGGTGKMCRVGHAFIKHYMREDGALFAGEVSGHYYYFDPETDFYHDNGWIPALQVMEIMGREKKKLTDLLHERKNYFLSGELSVQVTDKEEKMSILAERFSDADRIFHLDGISVEYPDWWFNVRPSNTEPLLRLNLEADCAEKVIEKRDLIMSIIS